ncbi:39S ribosomal protein L10, mitochondrial isoform X2 [Galleria mellonella]|uniref:Large ribosomal subunit protein uL10m n=1 Tax=Galleria mellonella TaxID=7137 RepID=A0A6J1WPM0_GALME|nr:39S ribosomal protein L10, mitochondrial isoform X2 [Galleria mellonella]
MTSRVFLQAHTPFILTRRFRGKINIQKPRKPHFERQLLLDLSKPIYGPSKNTLPDYVNCDRGEKVKKVEIDNPFERILANECLNWFNTSKMVVFLHVNSISMEEKTPVFAALKKNNMHLRTYGKKIVSMATKGTRYEVVNKLFTSHQNIIFGQPENADKMFKILKKTPQLVVMAAIIQDRLMSKNELVEFSKMPSLETARSQLCAVLENVGSSLVGQLNGTQQILVSHLEKHLELQGSTNKQDTES